MRIGIDIRDPGPAATGQQRHLWRLGEWLGEHGHDVHFIMLRQRPTVTLPRGTQLHRWHELSRRELRQRLGRLALDVLLLNPERSRRYRGVHANVLRPAYGTEHYRQKLRSFRAPGRALLRRALRLAPWELAERRWERAFYEQPDPPPHVIAVSHYLRAQILASYRIPDQHVHVVHNGVDLTVFNPHRRAGLRAAVRAQWHIPESAICLLFMGHNFRLKGLWQLVDVVQQLRATAPAIDLRIIAAGRGTGRAQQHSVRRHIAARGMTAAVHLVGPVQPAMHAFAAADAFVHLTWHDAFANVTLEALAAGLPALTTPYNGAAELIQDDVSGFVVHPADLDAVAAGVGRLLDADTRARIGTAAAAVAAQHPYERNFAEVLAVFELAAGIRDQAPDSENGRIRHDGARAG